MRLVVDLFWVVLLDHLERPLFNLNVVGICIVMPAQEAVLLPTEPSLLEWEANDISLVLVNLQMDVVATVHVLPEKLRLFSQTAHYLLSSLYPGLLSSRHKLFVSVDLTKVGISLEEADEVLQIDLLGVSLLPSLASFRWLVCLLQGFGYLLLLLLNWVYKARL